MSKDKSKTDTDFSETELKRMLTAFNAGNESSLKWNEILTHFAGQSDARQKAALKRISISAFETIKSNIDDLYLASRRVEIEALNRKSESIRLVKSMMNNAGVTTNDLLTYNQSSR